MPIILFAQKTDTLKLQEVSVSATRIHLHEQAGIVLKPDSTFNALAVSNNLSDNLSLFSATSFRTYGLAGLVTPSARGTGGSHTAVLWNGFNLQSAMNGIIDLSLVNQNSFDDVLLINGPSGSIWGNGAIGSAISLNSKAQFIPDTSLMLSLRKGSFGLTDGLAEFKISSQKVENQTSVQYRTAHNQFTFQDNTGFVPQERKMENAGFNQLHLKNNLFFNLRKNYKLGLNVWYLNSDRDLPAAITAINNLENQKDEALRFSASINKWTGKANFQLRSALFYEQIKYENQVLNIRDEARSTTSITEFEVNYYAFEKTKVSIGVHQGIYNALSANFGGAREQLRSAAYAAIIYKTKKEKFEFGLNGRYELVDGKAIPFIPTANVGLNVLRKRVFVFSKLGSSYRLPTFNDLYWQPGGNENLQPENGWNFQFGLKTQGLKRISVQLAAFHTQIENWILWLPGQGSFWSPTNVDRVIAKGIEGNFTFGQYQLSKLIKMKLVANVEFGATRNVTSSPFKSAKQLSYVPQVKTSEVVAFEIGKVNLLFQHQYQSLRYLNLSNNTFLPQINLFNLALNRSFWVMKSTLNFGIRVENILNTQYELVQYRPLPGRNFQLNLNIKLF